ncbi:hypothetical protein ABTM68_21210, partial [Acinetobacter baumannii]
VAQKFVLPGQAVAFQGAHLASEAEGPVEGKGIGSVGLEHPSQGLGVAGEEGGQGPFLSGVGRAFPQVG